MDNTLHIPAIRNGELLPMLEEATPPLQKALCIIRNKKFGEAYIRIPRKTEKPAMEDATPIFASKL